MQGWERILSNTRFKDLISGKKVIRENDAEIWISMARTLEQNGSTIRELFKQNEFDALKILKLFTEVAGSKSFPEYHKEQKIIIWLTRLERNVDFAMHNLNEIPMVSGSHIIRSTFSTGGIWGELNSMQVNLDELVVDYWHEVAEIGKKELHISPLQFQIYLWILSKYGCSPGREGDNCIKIKDCPVKDFCVQGTINIQSEYTHISTKQFKRFI